MPPFSDVVVYLEHQRLPPECQPARVFRKHGRTLVWIDEQAPCVEASAWIVEHLTLCEQNYIRAAYGAPPVGESTPRKWVSDDPVRASGEVPEVLRVPGRRRLLQSA